MRLISRPAPVVAIVALALGTVLLGVTVVGVTGGSPAPVPAPAASTEDTLTRAIEQAQADLRRDPDDAQTWAQLGTAYVEQARITGDPSYYERAQGALDRSMQVQPDDNAEAMLGLGALANARHDFTSARDWALRAMELRPKTAAVYGVLADALTQLGNVDGATAAVQQMLDLEPGVASFTRASYEFELHGRVNDARRALERALEDVGSRAGLAFCRYYLGELAFNSGDLDEAARQYDQGLEIAPDDARLRQGRAKVDAARGDVERALVGYQNVINRAPLPQYVQEYGELLLAVGRTEEAERQFELYRVQQRLYEAQGSTDDLAVALFLADHGDPAEALRRAQAEWDRRQSVFVADAMAWALHVNGRDTEALDYADRADALGWRNATFAYHRGMILQSLGRDDEAAEQLAEALEINPFFSPLYAPRARAALDELRSTG